MGTPYEIAKAELGVCEISGPESNPRILEYAKEAHFDNYQHDETAWCALFCNWALEKAGHPGTASLMARSFEGYGQKLGKPVKGCIVVLKRGNDPRFGHVGFFDHETKNHVYILGGNQGDKVSIARFPKDSVVCYRAPHQKTPAPVKDGITTTVKVGVPTAAGVEAVQHMPSLPVPGVPEAVTDSLHNVSQWQTIGTKLWNLPASFAAKPLASGVVLFAIAVVWLGPWAMSRLRGAR